MTERVIGEARSTRRRWTRRLAVVLALGGAIAAAGLFAVAAQAVVTDTHTGTECDIQVANKNLTDVCSTTAGAQVRYIGDSNQTFGSSGTGTFTPFVRLQGSPTERGYNTDGTVEFETKTGTWTHAILVSEIPVRTEDGCTDCWELFVDINESNNQKPISLNDMEIWFTTDENLTGYGTSAFTSGATLEYDFNGKILINDVNQGSGRGDLRYMVPRTGIAVPENCNYGNTLCETYFVLYSSWGGTAGFPSDGGFEEWKVKVYPTPPDVSVAKTPDGEAGAPGTIGAGSNAVFTMTITNNGPGASDVTLSDTLPTANGLDWSISSQGAGPGFTGGTACTLSAVDVLSCTITSMVNGTTYRVVVSSATTAANCGTINNTVTISATGDVSPANNTDTGSIVVQCGAIRILKNSTKGGAVNNAGAVFSITGAGITGSLSVTDDLTAAAPDEDADVGEVCVTGLQPGATYTVNETSPPTGYGGASQTNVTVVAVSGNCSTASLNSATFSNAPLGEFIINYNDLGSNETSAKIDCANITPTPADATPTAHDDDTETYTNLPAGNPPIVYSCTISVDP